MIAKVDKQGLLLTPEMLHGASEVLIRDEPGQIVIVLNPADDPIWDLGKDPITLDVDDASVNHDKYIYGQ